MSFWQLDRKSCTTTCIINVNLVIQYLVFAELFFIKA